MPARSRAHSLKREALAHTQDLAFAVPAEGYGTPYGSAPGQINCGYYLDKLTDDRGPTMVRCVSPSD